ncbi:MAG: helix-turn-helix domain-containing protein [Chitinophagaceae bacterium]|nr:helix-turn-helix domain-containing protein [Anaerolineae bacterium]
MQEISHFGLRGWRGYPGLMTLPHRHDDIEFNLVESGRMTYVFGSHQIDLYAGHFVLFWAAAPHQLIALEEDTNLIWLTLPLAWFLRWQLSDALTRRILNGEMIFVSEEAGSSRDDTLLNQWLEDLQIATPERRKIVLLELEARLRRLGLQTSEKSTLAKQGETSKAEQMAVFIANHYTEPLMIPQIAAAVHLHPNYAMKVFRQAYGRGLMDYVTQHRLLHAQRLLVTTQADILEIALEAGFGSSSSFYAAFKRICGQSPGQYRTALGGSKSE